MTANVAQLRASIRLAVVSLVVCAGLYPASLWVAARALAPNAAEGSLVVRGGEVVGSRLVAQRFTRPGYFWPRPSAAGYDAAAATGSNLSPASEEVAARARAQLALLHPPAGTVVPADLVTASGSGLDPDISVEAAGLQAGRVAAARDIPVERVDSLVRSLARPLGGLPDAPLLVNVLQLNLRLDRLAATEPPTR